MRYSTDLRKSVLDFVNKGGSKADAERTFGVSRQAIYKWLEAKDPFTYQKPGPKGPRDIDYDALEKHAADFPVLAIFRINNYLLKNIDFFIF